MKSPARIFTLLSLAFLFLLSLLPALVPVRASAGTTSFQATSIGNYYIVSNVAGVTMQVSAYQSGALVGTFNVAVPTSPTLLSACTWSNGGYASLYSGAQVTQVNGGAVYLSQTLGVGTTTATGDPLYPGYIIGGGVPNQPVTSGLVNTNSQLIAAGTVINTATQTNSADQYNYSCHAVDIDIVVTAGNAGNGLAVIIQGKDAGGNWRTLPVTMTAQTGTGTWGLSYGPANTSTGQSYVATGTGYLPLIWRAAIVSTDTTSCTVGLYESVIE